MQFELFLQSLNKDQYTHCLQISKHLKKLDIRSTRYQNKIIYKYNLVYDQLINCYDKKGPGKIISQMICKTKTHLLLENFANF